MTANPLATTSYQRVGTYIGQLLTQTTPTTVTVNRAPVYVGKGSRYAVVQDQPIVRCYITNWNPPNPPGTPLDFVDPTAPTAALEHAADGNKNNAVLYTGQGETINPSRWVFGQSNPTLATPVWDLVKINPATYVSTKYYYLNYQSVDQTLLDPIPIVNGDTRSIIRLGDAPGQNYYLEGQDYIINTEYTTPSPEVIDTVDQIHYPLPVNVGISQSQLAQAAQTPVTFYMESPYGLFSGKYNRQYTGTINISGICTVTVVAHSLGTLSTRTNAAGILVDPDVTFPPFTIDLTSATNLMPLDNGIALNIDGTLLTTPDSGKTFFALCAAPPIVEIDDSTVYTGFDTRNYQITINSLVSVPGSGSSVSFSYSTDTPEGGWNTDLIASDQASVVLPDGIKLWLSNQGSSVSTTLDPLYASLERQYPGDCWVFKAIDDETIDWDIVHTYPFSTQTILFDAMGIITGVRFAFYIILPEVPNSITSVTDANSNPLKYTLIVNGYSNTNYLALGTYGTATTASFTQPASSSAVTVSVEDTSWMTPSQTLTVDVAGAMTVTTIVDPQHVTLTNTGASGNAPAGTVLPIKTFMTATPRQFMPSVTNTGANPPVPSTSQINVTYTAYGNHPNPGATYYISMMVLRPLAYYNTPLPLYNQPQAQAVLAPNQIDANGNANDLYIMAGDIAFNQASNLPMCYVVQVYDKDQDGIYQNTDYEKAIDASEGVTVPCDVVVLNRYPTQSYQVASIERMSDPFKKRPRLGWFGPPVGMAVGNINQPGTIVYDAQVSLQIYGDSPAHGALLLCANQSALHTTVLYDGTSLQVTLDGSFLAGALTALQDGFNDPGTTILKQILNGFDSVQTFSDADELAVGGARCLFLRQEGSTVRIWESQTLDSTENDTMEASAMCQKQYVTTVVAAAIDSGVIGIVPASIQAGCDQIRATVSSTLINLYGSGLIGPWMDNGVAVPFDPQSMIEVYQDENDKTLYHFLYYYFLRYPLKRVFGLYSVDGQNWGAYSQINT